MPSSSFLVLRYFILPIGGSLFARDLDAEQKRDLFEKAFFSNWNFGTKRGSEVMFRSVTATANGFIGKFAKGKLVRIHEDTQDDIKESKVKDYPPASFISHSQEQMFLIEQKPWQGLTPKALCNVLSEFASGQLRGEGYSVVFKPIVPDNSFWDIVKQATGVYSMRFVFNSPNLFGANKSLNEELSDTRDLLNNTQTAVEFTNPEPVLKTPHEVLDKFLDYTDDGGGGWIIRAEIEGKKKTIRSDSHVYTVKINFEGELTEAELTAALARALNEKSFAKS